MSKKLANVAQKNFAKRCFEMLLVLVVLLSLASCHTATTQVAYLQDLMPNVSVALQEEQPIRLSKGDMVSIVVHGRDEEIVKMFNLGNATNNSASAGGNDHMQYTVDENGQIDMPILGPIAVSGLTREEVANVVKYRLLSGKLMRDPTVTVEFANLCYSMIGEVGSPGRKTINRDKITLLEALAEAGDLTIQGRRDNILVLRTENGKQTPYSVDLTKAQSLYSSPVFYLKQNDMIYVQPNDVKANQSTFNGSAMHTPSFWFSVISMISTIILLITK